MHLPTEAGKEEHSPATILMNFDNRMGESGAHARHHSVGTGGGAVEGMGHGAYPGGQRTDAGKHVVAGSHVNQNMLHLCGRGERIACQQGQAPGPHSSAATPPVPTACPTPSLPLSFGNVHQEEGISITRFGCQNSLGEQRSMDSKNYFAEF